ncbi:hypothetical protein [Salipiger thiooxidans]|uniref:hypothetical protein n=1 Tax=Salipiger thiooxidans TaxID=282683 RepID=UPI001CD52C73|nr:hypothetical protein [Salipiger thiooxidans]MCA0851405.1 hypothetical protein [Salipiger thiooxidans]
MGRTIYTNIEIRGKVYADLASAARANGVTSDAVRLAMRRGSLHRVGTGRVGREPMPVRIHGKDFPDAHAAAAHFGVTAQTIWSAINAGDPDRIGRPAAPRQAQEKPVTLHGVTFRSRAEASRALGFKNVEYISRALKRDTPEGRERIRLAVMKYLARRESEAMRRRGRGA